jgi:hypothetical protein
MSKPFYIILFYLLLQVAYSGCPDGHILVADRSYSNELTEIPLGFTYIGCIQQYFQFYLSEHNLHIFMVVQRQ